jgi:hypothetical protein
MPTAGTPPAVTAADRQAIAVGIVANTALDARRAADRATPTSRQNRKPPAASPSRDCAAILCRSLGPTPWRVKSRRGVGSSRSTLPRAEVGGRPFAVSRDGEQCERNPPARARKCARQIESRGNFGGWRGAGMSHVAVARRRLTATHPRAIQRGRSQLLIRRPARSCFRLGRVWRPATICDRHSGSALEPRTA